MLKGYGCRGYRAFHDETNVDLGQLTIVFGKNNSGKTTLTRFPLFLASSIDDPRNFSLTDGTIRFAANFRDLASFGQAHPAISYWATTSSPSEWRVTLQSVTQSLDETIHLTHLETLTEEFDFGLLEAPPEAKLDQVPAERRDVVEMSRSDVESAVSGLVHIPSWRPDIAPVYEARTPVASSVEEAPFWLYASKELRDDVDLWLRTNMDGLTLGLEQTDYGFRLTTGGAATPVNFASAGRGSQALLPVVTLLKAVSAGHLQTPLIVIEEPEAHLHPSAHAAVAELVVEASKHAQVLTETHSENFILRVRRKVAASELAADSVRLVYVDEDHVVETIHVDASGGVTYWPAGVFEYDVQEARAIIEARLKPTKVE